MSGLCIIPARGGSKRIPRKNLRPLHGRPLLVWSIAAAQRSELFDEIMVSTEDAEIADAARAAGASVPFLRSRQAAEDHAPTASVIREVLENYPANGRSFSAICCLYATAALTRPERLREGYRQLIEDSSLDTVMSVLAYGHPIERAFRMRDGMMIPADVTKQQTRTQDLEPAFHDAGQFYFFHAAGFLERGRMVGARCAPVMLSACEAVDLDSESDWELLERLMPREEMA